MDKRVIFAVAGSGKTTHILNSLDMDKKSLIITYTNENTKNLELGIKKQFDGIIPENITLMTYFTFLYSFCFIPFLGYKIRPSGICWDIIPSRFAKRNTHPHYFTKNNSIYANRISKAILDYNITEKVIFRIEKYFDNLFIDEIQDFAANDFNFIIDLVPSNLNILFVGDFYQHTFDTSKDGNTQSNLHADYEKYKIKFKNAGLAVDENILNNSHRCSPSTCDFISSELGIPIGSHKSNSTEIIVIDDQEAADKIFNNNEIVKLFYSGHSKYNCFSNNWGKSKGRDCYQDVCVVLYKKSAALLQAGKLKDLPVSSKNKLYVACSRASGNIYFVPDSIYKKFKKST